MYLGITRPVTAYGAFVHGLHSLRAGPGNNDNVRSSSYWAMRCKTNCLPLRKFELVIHYIYRAPLQKHVWSTFEHLETLSNWPTTTPYGSKGLWKQTQTRNEVQRTSAHLHAGLSNPHVLIAVEKGGCCNFPEQTQQLLLISYFTSTRYTLSK